MTGILGQPDGGEDASALAFSGRLLQKADPGRLHDHARGAGAHEQHHVQRL
jgi:hypothetical protein